VSHLCACWKLLGVSMGLPHTPCERDQYPRSIGFHRKLSFYVSSSSCGTRTEVPKRFCLSWDTTTPLFDPRVALRNDGYHHAQPYAGSYPAALSLGGCWELLQVSMGLPHIPCEHDRYPQYLYFLGSLVRAPAPNRLPQIKFNQ
jgi:hypothetical protein